MSAPLPFDAIVARLRAAGCVFAEEEAQLLLEAGAEESAGGGAALEELVRRRVGGEPLEHLLGWAEFDGLRIAVGPGVFVPRRRTVFLVASAMPFVRPGAVVVDLCCGTGAVGAAILARSDAPVELWASDLDPAAVAWARQNLGEGRVLEGDLFGPLPARLAGRVDVLAVNAPYVPTDAIRTMPPEARLHEAVTALDGGGDGLDLHRRIAREAPQWLAPGAHLLIETSRSQAPQTAGLLADAGLTTRIRRSAAFDATVVVAERPATARPRLGA
ncbi:putative protein N(5)-glutamine methyltransferase [Herbiconiux sp. CPCC 203407]|uniref:Methyltransferase small domain-containing protein n=1 Tax=Herbiconiux oxytropis TaxID=2970915 RepID=A0AA42BUH2_9MICO|nr:putative protein N(5)-glutamine methyltransferase [Herbiconiux oxytropis]MCS5722662.1 putative protein N(5)-glutamine methyltransferase [Herbiconiux oxytropis]MCS5725359.1 putative protein N(5)-glutamine methyltransferase [Herbiconiux oxytropis]